ncbi:MAG: hypothetical protein [Olavius algarvensis Gamma 3 endosymbiont]|nr:MAG: hypothetical protein [Olavius algarvensis Gamma 3 endosymbiont]
MKISRILILLALGRVLAGCVETSVIAAQPGANLPSDEVRVYFIERPQCNFETIAHIRVSGGFVTLASMLSSMRKKAAKLGADGLYLRHTQRLDTKEFLGTASAIRCLPI